MKEKYIEKVKGFGKKYIKLADYANRIIGEFQKQGLLLTVRGVMYQLIGKGWLREKNPYGITTRLLREGRDQGLIDWAAIEDRSRELIDWSEEGDTSPQDAIAYTADNYRDCFWIGQKYYLVVVVEKEALMEIVGRACTDYYVSHMAMRGDTSNTVKYDLAKSFVEKREEGREPIVIMVADHDPNGIDFERVIREDLTLYSATLDNIEERQEFTVERIGLTWDQAHEHDLPAFEVKEDTTKHGNEKKSGRTVEYVKKFGTKAWELDALPQDVLIDLIRTKVETYIDKKKWNAAKAKSERNKQLLQRIAAHWDDIVEQYGDE